MRAAIQKTKLYIPGVRAHLVDRPRLLKKLDDFKLTGHRLGLISAPAGSGKTTLVLQWLSGQDSTVAWVSLDQRDNQPARFFTYFIVSLQTMFPGVGKEALELLELPGVNLEEIITLLTNDLVEVPSPFLIVLDDFHNISNPELCQAIDLFMDAQPSKMSILLLSREDPSLQLARRRANDQLIEIRLDDLRFTLSEAIAFLNHCMGLDLQSSQVVALEARTEGWIAGLQMAALSLQHASDVDGFINEFSGSHRFILDYLMEEVLSHQSTEVQDFLLDTSILERMCAGLCAQVTQKTTVAAQKLLDSLARANLFIIPLDGEHRWYRYHHLFNDLLFTRLQGDEPGRLALLYQRASDWYEENGDSRLAVEYAIKASDFSRAVFLLELHIDERWQMGDLEFSSLIFQLPMDIITRRPALSLNIAWLYVLSGQFKRVAPFVEAADQCLSDPDRIPELADGINRAFAKTVRAFLQDSQNQPVNIDDTLLQSFAAIPESNTAMRNSVAVLLGTIYYMEGDFPNAIRHCQYALENEKRLGGQIAIPISVMRCVWALQAQGKLHQSLEMITENEAYVRQRGTRRYYISGVLNILWGEILLEWNRLDEAEAQLRQGLRLLEDWPVPQSFSLGMSLLARLQVASGEIEQAQATLRIVGEKCHLDEFHAAFIHAFQKAQTCLWIAEHNTPALDAFVRNISPLAAQPLSFRVEAPLVELCRALIALGRSGEAADLLIKLADSARGRNGSRLAILCLLVSAQKSQPLVAQLALEEALHLGEAEGYLRSFIDAGESLHYILDLWLKHPHPGISSSLLGYAKRIDTSFRGPGLTGTVQASTALPLIEPLTMRELDVLRLLVEGCSNKQIAERLVLAEGTVKYYVHGVLQKLDVHSRTQAIAKSRDLNLV